MLAGRRVPPCRTALRGGRRRPDTAAAATSGRILAITLDMARRGELAISGSIDGAAAALLSDAELDLVVAASPGLDLLHLRDGRVVRQVAVGFPRDPRAMR